jgi:hypothetical protein
MPNYQGVWSLSEQYQNASGWPDAAQYGFFSGGYGSAVGQSVTIERLAIASAGNTTNWGTLSTGNDRREWCGAAASKTRGLWIAGATTNVIDAVEFSSDGTATDFGDWVASSNKLGAASNSTRAITAGRNGYSNEISYITIAASGNAQDFGDLSASWEGPSVAANSTRCLFMGGENTTVTSTVEYVTISTAGNSVSFGNLTEAKRVMIGALSSSTRAVIGGGRNPTNATNTIEYLTIATTGNGTDFGDLTVARQQLAATSGFTRGIFFGGYTGSVVTNVIDSITIASAGNATDFGDAQAVDTRFFAGTSNAHGGLS